MKNRTYFYISGILFLFLSCFSYASEEINYHNSPTDITTMIKNGKNQNALNSINKRVKTLKRDLLTVKKANTPEYTTLYDDIAELSIVKYELLMAIGKEDEINRDEICNFILEYEEVEFIKTGFYKTPFHESVARTVRNIASLYKICHPPMAERYLNSLLKIKEHIYGKESAEVATVYDLLGDYYRLSMAEFSKAIAGYQKAKKIREKLYGVDDLRVTQNYNRLAISLFYHGEKSQSQKLIAKSLHIHKRDKNLSQLALAKVLIGSADFYVMTGEESRSLGYLKEAEKLLYQIPKEKSLEMMELYHRVSNLYLNLGDEKASQEYAKKVSLLKEQNRR